MLKRSLSSSITLEALSNRGLATDAELYAAWDAAWDAQKEMLIKMCNNQAPWQV